MDPFFDPDAPADSDGLFGLPHTVAEARVVVVPVPFEATTSFGVGTADAPEAVRVASAQVDLSAPDWGEPWQHGIALADVPDWLPTLAADARSAAEAARRGEHRLRDSVNGASERICNHVREQVARLLDAGRIPAVLGGDHSVPLGAFQAAVKRFPGMGILHIDAHADLREAYEGFQQSHASIFHNALRIPGLGPVVQVGLRDVGACERRCANDNARVHWWTDDDVRRALHQGKSFASVVAALLEPLPEAVWISFDVDGLDPALCPGTGTPVPGGLSWREALTLLEGVKQSGRRVIGFDLCEVGSGAWDANVGARLLYVLSGLALVSQQEVS